MRRRSVSTGSSRRITNRPSNAQIELQIRTRLGKPVHFKYPGNEGSRRGVLKDRVIIRSNPTAKGVPYWDVVDLIEFPDAPEPLWMKVGYYRYTEGRRFWGSQTTLTDPLSAWRRLFVKAKSRPWFTPLLRV